MCSMTVEVSGEMNVRLDEISRQFGLSKIEVVRRALNLLDVIAERKTNDQELVLVDKETMKPVLRLLDIL